MMLPPAALVFLVFFQAPPSPALEQGRALTASFYKGELDALWARFSAEMKKGIGSVENLRGFRTQVEAQAGVEEKVLDEKVEPREGFQVYQRVARFSKAPLRVMVVWTLDKDGTVAGFFIRPVPEEPTREQLDYVTKTELRLPFTGAWFVFWGGRTVEQNYHFATHDQRFAYDIVVQKNGTSHAGEGKRNEDYYHLQDSAEFGKGRGLPAPFKGYRADGKAVERGEPVKGQVIESR